MVPCLIETNDYTNGMVVEQWADPLLIAGSILTGNKYLYDVRCMCYRRPSSNSGHLHHHAKVLDGNIAVIVPYCCN